MGQVVVVRWQPAYFLTGFFDLADAGVRVDTHRGRHIEVAADLLDRLEINARLRQRRDVSAPDDVGRDSDHIDLLVKIPQQPAGHHQRGRLLAADDIYGVQVRHQETRKLVVQRNHAHATLYLRGRDICILDLYIVIQRKGVYILSSPIIEGHTAGLERNSQEAVCRSKGF